MAEREGFDLKYIAFKIIMLCKSNIHHAYIYAYCCMGCCESQWTLILLKIFAHITPSHRAPATFFTYESPCGSSEPSSMTTIATIKDSGIIRPTQRIHKADSTLRLQVGVMAPRRTEQRMQASCSPYVPPRLGMVP